MAFNPLTGLAVAAATSSLRSRLDPSARLGSVIDFGNQRFRLTLPVLKRICKQLDCKLSVPSSEPDFSSYTPRFFKDIGYSSYSAIDMNDKMSAIPMDLNTHLATSYRYKSLNSLVIDNGTGEHVFDQHMVFRNQHDLCQPGGIILNNKPFLPWINHGFYSFHPVLFRDLAYANSYEHVFTWIGGNHGEYVDVTGNDDIWVELPRSFPFWKRPKSNLEKLIYDQLLEKNNISIVVAYRKTNSLPFNIPLQGKWVHNIEDPSIREQYGNQPDTYSRYHS